MALLGNYSVYTKNTLKYIGGSGVQAAIRDNFAQSGRVRSRMMQDQTTVALQKYALPNGGYPSLTWFIPQQVGAIGSSNQIYGAGTQTANLAGGLNAQAGLTGAGDITSATAQLIISMAASLAGNGTVSAADLRGFLNAVANLSGSGNLTAAAAALAWIQAATDGSGTITNATPYASGSMSANILSYSALTPEGIRDAVWNAIAANYDLNATMGELLHNAAAGGGGGGSGLTLGQFLALQNP